MAFDPTPPRSNLIFMYALLSVAFLLAVKFALDGYFDAEFLGERAAKVRAYPAQSLAVVRQTQQRLLQEGALPIDRAVQKLQGVGLGASARAALPAITPRPSDDVGALEGWKELQPKPAAR